MKTPKTSDTLANVADDMTVLVERGTRHAVTFNAQRILALLKALTLELTYEADAND